MVDRAGLEPTIPRLKGECFGQLSYRSGWANTGRGFVLLRGESEQVPVRNGTTRNSSARLDTRRSRGGVCGGRTWDLSPCRQPPPRRDDRLTTAWEIDMFVADRPTLPFFRKEVSCRRLVNGRGRASVLTESFSLLNCLDLGFYCRVETGQHIGERFRFVQTVRSFRRAR
jgi:hypothetical protein